MRNRIFFKILRQFYLDAGGNVIILFAFAIFMLVTCIGTAIDMARAQILQSNLSSALDAAGLAALKVYNGTNITVAQANANRVFYANFPSGYLNSSQPSLNVVAASVNQLQLTASTQQNTMILPAVGITSVKIGASSQVTRAHQGVTEVVMVLDNTGSMSDPVSSSSSVSKISALQTAAKNLVSIVLAPGTVDTYVGIVPFTVAVNIGTNHLSWLQPGYASYDWGPGGFSNNWLGCVMARRIDLPSLNNAYSFNDTPPNVSNPDTLFSVYYEDPDYNHVTYLGYTEYVLHGKKIDLTDSELEYDPWSDRNPLTPYPYAKINYAPNLNYSFGPSMNCPQSVTPMTNDPATLNNAINNMYAIGNTIIDQGLAWGWRMLSPNWQNMWGGTMDANNLPMPTPTAANGNRKFVILMTDGTNQFTANSWTAYKEYWYGPFYNITFPESEVESQLDKVTENVCYDMAQQGIVIFTIAFGSTGINNTLLQYCAANDPSHYFLASDNAGLDSAFRTIANEIANVRVSQ